MVSVGGTSILCTLCINAVMNGEGAPRELVNSWTMINNIDSVTMDYRLVVEEC